MDTFPRSLSWRLRNFAAMLGSRETLKIGCTWLFCSHDFQFDLVAFPAVVVPIDWELPIDSMVWPMSGYSRTISDCNSSVPHNYGYPSDQTHSNTILSERIFGMCGMCELAGTVGSHAARWFLRFQARSSSRDVESIAW